MFFAKPGASKQSKQAFLGGKRLEAEASEYGLGMAGRLNIYIALGLRGKTEMRKQLGEPRCEVKECRARGSGFSM